MRYANETQKENIIALLIRHGYSYKGTTKTDVIVYENEHRYRVNIESDI